MSALKVVAVLAVVVPVAYTLLSPSEALGDLFSTLADHHGTPAPSATPTVSPTSS